MINMASFVDESVSIKIAAAAELAGKVMPFLKQYGPYAGAAGVGALGLHQAKKTKRRYDIGKMVEEQQARRG